jgi:Ca2+-transporting ATPase
MQYAVGASLVLMLLVIYVPFLQPIFDTVPLTFQDWIVMTPFIAVASIAAEMTKFFMRKKFYSGKVVTAD